MVGLGWSTDGSSTATEVRLEYLGTDASRWVDVFVGACGNSFLVASIFLGEIGSSAIS